MTCHCGCGQPAKQNFLPGHDRKLGAKLEPKPADSSDSKHSFRQRRPSRKAKQTQIPSIINCVQSSSPRYKAAEARI